MVPARPPKKPGPVQMTALQFWWSKCKYLTFPKAAKIDRKLYEMLALVDAVRDGRARDRQIAEQELRVRLA